MSVLNQNPMTLMMGYENSIRNRKLYNFLNLLILSVLFVLFHIPSAFSQDFEYPEVVDGGEIPIAVDSAGKPVSVQKNIAFKLKNISNEPIYLLKYQTISLTPYQSIDNLSNSASYSGFLQYTLIKESSLFNTSATFYIDFLDSLSKNGIKLKFKSIIYYRKLSSSNLDSISFELHFKAVEIQNTFSIPFVSIYNNTKKYFGVSSKKVLKFISTIYNPNENSFIIDSVQYNVIGKNLVETFFRSANDNVPKFLPLTLKPNTFVYFADSMQYLIPEKTLVPFSIFGHYENDSKKVILSDTSINLSNTFDDLSIMNNSVYDLIAFTDQEISLNHTITYNYTDSVWSLVKFDYKTDNSEYFKFFTYPLPRKIETNFSMEYGSGLFKTDKPGIYKVLSEFDYEDDFGNKTKHTVLYVIKVTKDPTDVNDDLPNNESMLVFPNPAGDYINISFNSEFENTSKIEIYNQIGIKVKSIIFDSRLFIGDLPAGLYFIKSGNKSTKFIKE